MWLRTILKGEQIFTRTYGSYVVHTCLEEYPVKYFEKYACISDSLIDLKVLAH